MIQHRRRQRPDRHQHDLALQIVAELDLFLVLVGRVVDVVVALRLEEEVTGLARGHRDQPADQRRHRRIDEQHHIGEQEARRADEVQRLVDPAVVIITMVIPTLGTQFLQEILDHCSSPKFFRAEFTGIRCRPCDIMIMTYDLIQRRVDAELSRSGDGRGRLGFAETHQREMAERRNQAALGEFDAISARQPLRIARPGELGGAEAERANHRLQPLSR